MNTWQTSAVLKSLILFAARLTPGQTEHFAASLETCSHRNVCHLSGVLFEKVLLHIYICTYKEGQPTSELYLLQDSELAAVCNQHSANIFYTPLDAADF